MEGKVFLCQNLIWAMILLGQIHENKSCTVKEREALMELTVNEDIYATKNDCCQWEGVNCSRTTGRIIKLSFHQLSLKERFLLNLSLLHPFEDLQSLDLSKIGFIGWFDDVEGYKSLRRLRNLEILDLSVNRFNNSIIPFLNAATSLTTLFLQWNYMDGPFPIKELKVLKNLELVDLSENRFNGSIPIRELSALRNLKVLDLSGNKFSGSLELQELKNWTHLEAMGLGRNKLSGPIPIEAFCEMKNLHELDLGGNYIGGKIPSCVGSLNKLRVLDLSSNQIGGNIPYSFRGLEALEYLSLLDNNFTGLFSLNPLANLTKLKVFKISSTSDMIQVETVSTWQPKFQLSVAKLPFCSLEKIPNFLNYQKNLRLVDLSSNRLSGHIPMWLLGNNPELEVLQLKNNLFTIFHMPTLAHKLRVLDFSANDIGGALPENIGHALPNLFKMNISNNVLQGNFPSSMGEMKNITILDLSYNNFTGELPRSFVLGCFSLKFLKLSHNKFCGHFLTRRTNFTSLRMLIINNNLITGKIGAGLRSSRRLSVLDMSNNHLTGAIPIWVSNFSLEILMISNNSLEGVIPPSLLFTDYTFMDLSGNRLSGSLPSYFHNSYDFFWKSLFLHNNNLTGPIPGTLFENITMLDLRNNKFSGSIPQFVEAQDIRILLLKGNYLTGSIPRQLCAMNNIRLLDLSNNKLNGFIPSCLNNLSFGLGGDDETYSAFNIWFTEKFTLEFYKSTLVTMEFKLGYSTFIETEINFAMKKRYDSYKGASESGNGILDYMYGLDLSSNELSGVIPTEFGDLSKLKALNLSHNLLSSSIPDSFSKLKDIESLDLSFNMLHGSIPHELTSLTFLSSFNVSYNNLSDIIPQGRQFGTFNEKSYLGNPLLCGKPTIISCETTSSEEADNEGEGEEDEDDGAFIDILVFYWSIASSYVIALIGSLVVMSFDCPWRRAWLRLIDAFIVSGKSV